MFARHRRVDCADWCAKLNGRQSSFARALLFLSTRSIASTESIPDIEPSAGHGWEKGTLRVFGQVFWPPHGMVRPFRSRRALMTAAERDRFRARCASPIASRSDRRDAAVLVIDNYSYR